MPRLANSEMSKAFVGVSDARSGGTNTSGSISSDSEPT